jgi:hypothetical protein
VQNIVSNVLLRCQSNMLMNFSFLLPLGVSSLSGCKYKTLFILWQTNNEIK